jgi:fibro-slime domain-containing protein
MKLELVRFYTPAFVGWLGLASALASCSSKHQYDDDDSGGAAGVAAGPSGTGGSSARGGSSNGGKGATGAGGTKAAGGTGGDVSGAGEGDMAGAPPGAGGGANGGTGGTHHGTGGSGATGATGATGEGGANDAGAGSGCSGASCGCMGADCSVCGDGKVTGSEACDDGNLLPFDGCSPTCEIEPGCTSGGCTTTCGDGIVGGDEECDDGNAQSGDGCSSACKVEAGYTCTSASCDGPGGACVLRLPVVFRDFNASTAPGGHPDFQPGVDSLGVLQGLVQPDLDADGKPVLSSTASPTNGFMHGQDAFAEWYRDGAPSSGPIPGEVVLWDDGAGGYVNRWGKNGEQWVGYPNSTYTYCDQGCATCGTPGPNQVCLDTCTPYYADATFACIMTQQRYDGNPLFFPIDNNPKLLTETRLEGKVPEQYGWAGWPWEPDVATALGVTTPIQTATAPFPSATHNFSFTTELKFWFRYDASTTQTLSFLGDDDAWVFLNGHLAVDLGGWHVPLDGTLTLAGGLASSSVTTRPGSTPTVVTQMNPVDAFGLEDGKLYQLAVFHAEREAQGSSFKLGLRGLDVAKSTCTKN